MCPRLRQGLQLRALLPPSLMVAPSLLACIDACGDKQCRAFNTTWGRGSHSHHDMPNQSHTTLTPPRLVCTLRCTLKCGFPAASGPVPSIGLATSPPDARWQGRQPYAGALAWLGAAPRLPAWSNEHGTVSSSISSWGRSKADVAINSAGAALTLTPAPPPAPPDSLLLSPPALGKVAQQLVIVQPQAGRDEHLNSSLHACQAVPRARGLSLPTIAVSVPLCCWLQVPACLFTAAVTSGDPSEVC